MTKKEKNKGNRKKPAGRAKGGGGAGNEAAGEADVILRRGMDAHRAGRFGEAEKAYLHLLALVPDHADVQHLLGILYLAAGREAEAVVPLSRAVELRPEFVEAHSHLGGAMAKSGRWDEAVMHCRRAIELQPDYLNAYLHLGLALAESGREEEAEACYRKALSLQPQNGSVWESLGTILSRHRPKDAVAAYQKALTFLPDRYDLHNNLGTCLMELGRYREALVCFDKAIALHHAYPIARANLGAALALLGRPQEALASVDKAIALRPDYADAFDLRGAILRDLGRLDEARVSLRRAIALKPDCAEAYRHLALFEKFKEGDDEVRAMVELYGSPSLINTQRMHLAFGLGKIFEDLGRYREAFVYFQEGCGLKRATYSYDTAAVRPFFERIRQVFSHDFFVEHQQAGHQDGTPIFIVGMPRSGTSLVEQILASHPNVYGAGELRELESAARGLGGQGFPENVLSAGAAGLAEIGQAYVAGIRRLAPEAMCITDKLPHNFLRVGLIRAILPNARVIHCMRNPVATCLSVYKHFFTGHHGYAYDLEELGAYYRLYEGLMEHWRSVLPPGWMYEIAYEELVANQEVETRKLLAYCGLEWNDACLSFHRTERRVGTASALQVRQPMYRDSVGLHEKYGEALDPLCRALGMAPVSP